MKKHSCSSLIRFVLPSVTACVLFLVGSQLCVASSITLISSSSGVYDYGMTINPSEIVGFSQGQTITLSGLSGVTGASVSDFLTGLFTVSSFTSDSVVFEQSNISDLSFGNAGGSPATFASFVVDSSVLTIGTIDYSMATSAGSISGTVNGPVATPEPTSLTLVGLALLGLALACRRDAGLGSSH